MNEELLFYVILILMLIAINLIFVAIKCLEIDFILFFKKIKKLPEIYCNVVGDFLEKILKKTISSYSNLNKDNYSLFGYFIVIFLVFICFSNLFIGELEYFVYQILRISVFLFCIWSLYLQNQKQKMQSWILPNLAIAILFNPIAPITLEKDVWAVVDFVALVYLIVFQWKWRRTDCHGDKSPRNDEVK